MPRANRPQPRVIHRRQPHRRRQILRKRMPRFQMLRQRQCRKQEAQLNGWKPQGLLPVSPRRMAGVAAAVIATVNTFILAFSFARNSARDTRACVIRYV